MNSYKWRKHLLAITFILLFAVSIQAQSMKVKQATSQGWAGGVCCSQGINYNIYLELIRTRHPIILDTLWLEGYCKDLSKYNQKKNNLSDTINIQIQEGLSFTGREFDINPNEILPKGCYDESKKGVIIEYRIGKKKMFLDISAYVTELMYIAYP